MTSENLKEYVLERHNAAFKAYESVDDFGEWDGFYSHISKLYPDNAHFVFELLQNAEDAKAKKVRFELLDGSLIFKHDGSRDFSKKDIKSITGIANSSKKEDTNTIGQFGVGFKSVFAYTTTPKIYSKSISFKIENLFVPSLIKPHSIEKDYTTQFIFPFDRDDKSKEDAFSEVKGFFDELSDNVLLFLKNINSIEWKVLNSKANKITKEKNNEFVEINNTKRGTSYWLVFWEKVDFNSELTVNIAYSYNKEKKKIEPIRGDVSIFFPAKKETSKLKFHIDAPFASTIARDSIKDLAENEAIMANIARLCCSSIHKIKDQGLLSTSFLEVLPNNKDELDEFYKPILDDIKAEFESEEFKLIPLENGKFSNLDNCKYVSNEVIKTFKDDNDINMIFDSEDLIGFVKHPKEGSRVDDFLSALFGYSGIYYQDAEVCQFLRSLSSELSDFNKYYHYSFYSEAQKEEITNKLEWLNLKSDSWLQSFYAFLGDDLYLQDNYNSFIKQANGGFNFDNKSLFFPAKNISSDVEFTFVNSKTYTYGDNKKIQEQARAFLEAAGVESVDESTHVSYLFNNNKYESDKQHLNDINRLVKLYINNKEKALESLREGRYIKDFLLSDDYLKYSIQELEEDDAYEDKPLISPTSIFIDSPYQETGLELIHVQLDYVLFNLDPIYENLENLPEFLKLLKDLGAHFELKIIRQGVYDNPEYDRMWNEARGAELRDTGICSDWTIENLDLILELKNNRLEISKLLWNRLNTAESKVFEARLRKNSRSNMATADSHLIYTLKTNEWIPGKDGEFYKPADINEEMLPIGFLYVNSNEWLDWVDFAENLKHKEDQYEERKKNANSFNITFEQGERLKKINDPDAFDDWLKSQEQEQKKKLDNALSANKGTGNTEEVAPSGSSGEVIINPDGLQDDIGKENRGVSTQTTTGSTKKERQDPAQVKKVKNFLHSQYKGHCQICGDTFNYKMKVEEKKNYFVVYSLNRSIKGDSLKSDVKRKGNTLSLCPKHHAILSLQIAHYSFFEDYDNDELSLDTIKNNFEFSDYVGREDVFNENDGFFNMPNGSDFEAENVFFLPIKIFKKTWYIKFTQEHIQNYIEVKNSN